MSLGDAQRALRRVCLAAAPDPADLALLGGPVARWLAYRNMVRNRLRESVEQGLPRTRAALGPAALERWVSEFLASAPPQTRYIRDVTTEFVRFAVPRWRDAPGAVPTFAPDLARYECAVLECAYAAADAQTVAPTEFAMDRPAALSPAHRCLRVRWGVHRAFEPGDAPCEPFALLVYRDAERHTVETLELTPIAADIVDAMAPGERAVQDCVRAVLARHDAAPGPVFLDSLAELLADLLERGVVLGSRGA